MLVFRYFGELALVVRLVFQVVLAHQVRPFDQVVAQIDIASFRQTRFFRHELTGRVLAPDQADKLGELRMIGKTVDVRNLGDHAGRDDRSQALHREQGIGNPFHALGDLPVKAVHEFFEVADVRPRHLQHDRERRVEVRRNGEGVLQGTLHMTRRGFRVVKAFPPGLLNQLGQLREGHGGDLGDGELGEQGGIFIA